MAAVAAWVTAQAATSGTQATMASALLLLTHPAELPYLLRWTFQTGRRRPVFSILGKSTNCNTWAAPASPSSPALPIPALTKEQQTFATAHHSLVYKFLNENRLPEDEFYDVVIFGYLKAVRDYFSDLTAQQFTFSTIANRRMKFCLFDYFRTQERRKRNMEVLSIHVGLYPDGAPLEDTIPAHDPIMQQLEMDLLLHELAGRVSKQQMDIVHLKQGGYGIREIARTQKVPMRRIKELLAEVHDVLLDICYG